VAVIGGHRMLQRVQRYAHQNLDEQLLTPLKSWAVWYRGSSVREVAGEHKWRFLDIIRIVQLVELNGAPNTIRTCGLPLRRGMLYPSELPGRYWGGMGLYRGLVRCALAMIGGLAAADH
jgi:hypothetical protein